MEGTDCFRCGSLIDQKLWKLSEEVLYCRACIQLGRIRSDQKLYTIAQRDFEGQEVLNWKGTLTSLSTRGIRWSHQSS